MFVKKAAYKCFVSHVHAVTAKSERACCIFARRFSTCPCSRKKKSNLKKKRVIGVYQFLYVCRREIVSFARDYPVSLYKNLNTRARATRQYLLKANPLSRFYVFSSSTKGHHSLPECIDVKRSRRFIGVPADWTYDRYTEILLCRRYTTYRLLFGIYILRLPGCAASALPRICDSLHISAMYCINLDECHLLCVCARVCVHTRSV